MTTDATMLFNLKAQLRLVLSEFNDTTSDHGHPVYSGDDDCRMACCMIDSMIKAVDRSDDVQRFLFKSGVQWPTHREPATTIDNLKLVMMALGNSLVSEHGYEPGGCFGERNNTRLIQMFTEWVNENPDAIEVLHRLGYEWPTVDRPLES